MPSPEHEARVDLVKKEPVVAAKLLCDVLRITSLPHFENAELQPADLSQLRPTEYRADSVVALTNARGDPVAAVVVEVQRSRDEEKRFTWPVYLATLREQMRCPTWLVVITDNEKTEAWADRSIYMGQLTWILRPLVVGPTNIPVITDPRRAAEQPWLAALSAMTHHTDEECEAIFRALLDGVIALGDPEALRYVRIVQAGLRGAAFEHLEALVSTEPKYRPTFLDRAEARGEAKALITVLTSRGLELSAAERERVTSCTDPAQLTDWLSRAATVRRADDLFG